MKGRDVVSFEFENSAGRDSKERDRGKERHTAVSEKDWREKRSGT